MGFVCIKGHDNKLGIIQKSRRVAGPIPDLLIPTLEGFSCQDLGGGVVGQIVDGLMLWPDCKFCKTE